jgi:acyl transferase domain-containing protein
MHSDTPWRPDPSRKLVFLFSGQGSHYYQMGRELHERHPSFRKHFAQLGEMAHDICGVDLAGTLYDDARKKNQWFDDITLTHPAIYAIEYALALTLIDHDVRPDGVLGVSMGNFAAASVAGSMGPEDAFEALNRQARAAAEYAQPGALLAVLGDAALQRRDALLAGHTELAGVNTPSSFILALPERGRALVEAHLRELKIPFLRMMVSRAFHSRWIDDAAPMAQWDGAMAAPRLPWFCTTHAELVTSPDAAYLWTVARQPIRLVPTLRRMEQEGGYDYLDLSPSGTLALALRHLLPPGSPASHMAVMGVLGSDLERLRRVTGP